MTLAEMEREFEGEWVVIAEPNLDEMTELLGGRVVFHSGDRDAAWQAVRRLGLHSAAVWFMGPVVPEGVAVVL